MNENEIKRLEGIIEDLERDNRRLSTDPSHREKFTQFVFFKLQGKVCAGYVESCDNSVFGIKVIYPRPTGYARVPSNELMTIQEFSDWVAQMETALVGVSAYLNEQAQACQMAARRAMQGKVMPREQAPDFNPPIRPMPPDETL